MELSYWINKWNAGDTKFHLADPHPALARHVGLLPGQGTTVLVPLCGKSVDMLWLSQECGYNVVGIEASPLACRAFFGEHGLPYKEEKRGDFILFRGAHVTIWCGDFFSTEKRELPKISAVYDRAALIALPEDVRVRYAAYLRALLPEGGVTYFLISMEYPRDDALGPPFSVGEEEVRALYGERFDVSLLEQKEDPVTPSINVKFAGMPVVQTVYLLKDKTA